MLLSQALCRLVNAWDQGVVSNLSEVLLSRDIALVLFQVLMQTLQKQNANGSWGRIPSKEITAYAIIALGNLASLPFSSQVSGVIRDAIAHGGSFLNSSGLGPDVEYVWIAKTNYSPVNVSKAYILAALETKFPKYSLGSPFNNLLNLPGKAIRKYTHMFSSLPTLNGFPLWRIEGSVTEGCLFLDKPKDAKLNTFDRSNLKGDEYFEFIAMTLACSNNLHSSFLKTDILFDMMTFILHVYQVDEYFEHVIGVNYEDHLPEIKRLVEKLMERRSPEQSPAAKGVTLEKQKLEHQETNGTHLQQAVLSDKTKSFTNVILENPAVQKADPVDRSLLEHELRRCLLAHISQLESSKSHCQSTRAGSEWKTTCGSYHEWVRTVGAAHSYSPLSLAYFRCLLPQDIAGRHVSAEEQYLTQDLWMHLANKARMENDRSSVRRNGHEGNLNSVDFPEFNRANGGDATVDSIAQLTRIIDYEKRCCKLGFEELEGLSDVGGKNSQLEAFKFYNFLVELYNDVYVLKDISSGRTE